MTEPIPPLDVSHLRAFAAWLSHGPGTIRQVSLRSDMHLIDLHPRTQELIAVGGLRVVGQSDSEGPIYSANISGVHTPSAADIVERQLNSMAVRDQVSIAAGIMARHGRRGKRPQPGANQSELL